VNTRDDLLIVNNALNEVLHGPEAIDEAKFQMRIGQERVKALDLASAKSWIRSSRALRPSPARLRFP
jgi:hypothetical protein